jgi:hypothetical protein
LRDPRDGGQHQLENRRQADCKCKHRFVFRLAADQYRELRKRCSITRSAVSVILPPLSAR